MNVNRILSITVGRQLCFKLFLSTLVLEKLAAHPAHKRNKCASLSMQPQGTCGYSGHAK